MGESLPDYNSFTDFLHVLQDRGNRTEIWLDRRICSCELSICRRRRNSALSFMRMRKAAWPSVGGELPGVRQIASKGCTSILMTSMLLTSILMSARNRDVLHSIFATEPNRS